MPIGGPRYRFNLSMIDGAPDERGVYALWDHQEVIYYGRSSGGSLSIQQALRAHSSGRAGACTRAATHYSWEICSEPSEREAELLSEYEAQFKCVPRCNADKP
jgi:hypothetical protein